MYLSITTATLLFQYGDWYMYVAPLLILFQKLCNQCKLEFRDFAKQTEVSRLGLEFHYKQINIATDQRKCYAKSCKFAENTAAKFMLGMIHGDGIPWAGMGMSW